MKKIILTSFALITIGNLNAQLANLDFEAWSGSSPTGWTTLNAFASGSFSQISTGAPQGLYAGSGNVVNCPFCPAAGLPNPFPGSAAQQKPYVARPDTLSFKWKGDILTGDTALIGVYLKLATVPIGDALFYVMPGTSQSTWLTVTMPFTYSSGSAPDTAIVGALSDAWVLGLLPGYPGSGSGTSSIGTHIDVDDIQLTGGTVGISLLKTDNSLILAYPNPAKTIINFNLLGTDISNMEIIDVAGKLIYTENNILSKHVLNIENYKSGSYIVKFFNDKKEYIGSAKFNVVK